MAETTGKRFSNVRFWRYVFTPTIFLMMIFGIFMLYGGSPATTTANFPSLTGIVRRNTNVGSLNSVLANIQKFRT